MTTEETDRDFDLLQRWRDGDRAAGDTLLGAHFPSVYRFFRSKVPDHAEDLAQRTLLGCVEARDRIDRRDSFRAYLFGVARKRLADHFRRYHRRDARTDFGVSSIAELGGSPSRVLADQETRDLLVAAMQRIPVDFQIALELFYWESMSVRDIACVLDIAEGTVKSRLSRAKGHLREQMKRMQVPPGVIEQTLGDLDGA